MCLELYCAVHTRCRLLVLQGPRAARLLVRRQDVVQRVMHHGGKPEAFIAIGSRVKEHLPRDDEMLILRLHLLKWRWRKRSAVMVSAALLGRGVADNDAATALPTAPRWGLLHLRLWGEQRRRDVGEGGGPRARQR